METLPALLVLLNPLVTGEFFSVMKSFDVSVILAE